jgi:hypothetical protein
VGVAQNGHRRCPSAIWNAPINEGGTENRERKRQPVEGGNFSGLILLRIIRICIPSILLKIVGHYADKPAYREYEN